MPPLARLTTRMKLNVWDTLMHRFNHTELAYNWDKIDAHDHTGDEAGVKISSGAIENAAVTGPAIADSAVGTAKITDRAVTTGKIALQGVETANLKDGAVTEAKLAPEALIRLGTSDVYYYKAMSRVYLVGEFDGTTGAPALPAGYRPSGTRRFVVPTTVSPFFTRLTVNSSGVLASLDEDDATFYVDGISFRV